MRASLSSGVLAVAALLSITSQALAQDECAVATPVIVGANGPFDTTGSTLSTPTFACGFVSGGDLWYSFTTPGLGGLLTIDTAGSTTDTVLEVFDACGGTSVACDDDGGPGATSTVSFVAAPSTTYFARVALFGGAFGPFNLNVAYVTPDDCVGALPLADGVNGPFSNSGSTSSLPAQTCNTAGLDVWFVHTASCNGTLTINTEGGTLTDTVMTAYASCGGASLGCDDDGGPGLYSQLTFPVVAGVSYFFQVGDFLANSSGTFNVRVNNVATPGSFPDNCACAAPLTLGANAIDTTGSTMSTPAFTCGTVTGGDLWYSYTVAGPGCANVQFDTVGSGVDTVIEVWSACGGTVLDCNDDIVFPPGESQVVLPSLVAGTSLRVRVARWGAAFGAFTLNVSETSAAPSNDECATASAVALGANGPFNNSCATNSAPGFTCATGNRDLWFDFTASFTAPHTLDTFGSGFDTVLQVYDACGGLSVGCNDDAVGLESRLTASLTAGVTYKVRVGGFGANVGNILLNIRTGTTGGSITPDTTVSLCPSPATLNVAGDPWIGGTLSINLVGATGLGFTGYGFSPLIPIPTPCGCDIISDGIGGLGFFQFLSTYNLPVPVDPFLIGATVQFQGLDVFPTSGGCTFSGIPFGATNIWTAVIG